MQKRVWWKNKVIFYFSILKSVEFSGMDTAENGEKKSLEVLLLEKNKALQSGNTSLRAANQEAEGRFQGLTDWLTQLEFLFYFFYCSFVLRFMPWLFAFIQLAVFVPTLKWDLKLIRKAATLTWKFFFKRKFLNFSYVSEQNLQGGLSYRIKIKFILQIYYTSPRHFCSLFAIYISMVLKNGWPQKIFVHRCGKILNKNLIRLITLTWHIKVMLKLC